MAILSVQDLALIFGLLGNIVSLMVFLAPVPTFYSICKRKTSEGFQSIPYVATLLSASLLLYYASLKTNAYLILSINAFGCVTEAIYLTLFITYASRRTKIFMIKLILLFNVGCFGVILLVSLLLTKGSKRVTIVGWTCGVINLVVFASPLSIMSRVIRTKSVEFMPLALSFFLTLCAIMWFFYGIFVEDYYFALSNLFGFIFGVAQIILYLVYKNGGNQSDAQVNSSRNATDRNSTAYTVHVVP